MLFQKSIHVLYHQALYMFNAHFQYNIHNLSAPLKILNLIILIFFFFLYTFFLLISASEYFIFLLYVSNFLNYSMTANTTVKLFIWFAIASW